MADHNGRKIMGLPARRISLGKSDIYPIHFLSLITLSLIFTIILFIVNLNSRMKLNDMHI
jgi:hypothetical protein